jgi:hypothetical protein
MSTNHRTLEEKLKFLSREWGFAEVTRVTMALSGDQKFIVKNYRGELPTDWERGDPLRGNPRATKVIERSGNTLSDAVTMAYSKMKQRKKKK